MVDFAASDPVAGKATLNRTVQCIRTIIQAELVILFGSRGRREAGEENDYDHRRPARPRRSNTYLPA
jgi:predicted nucleotidyltransferase